MKTIYERLDKIIDTITNPNFMEHKGLGNDIGFYVFDYDPNHELLVRDRVNYIKEKVNSLYGLKIVEFDLYEIIIEHLKEKGYLERNFEMEERKGSEYVLLKATKKTLRITNNDDIFINYIKERLDDCDIVFLTGVGKAWPIIRSHTILNNLHSVVEKQPLVMFFPGTYDGGELRLFNIFKDDNYYRAFELVNKY